MMDAPTFSDWRARNGLSWTGAAEALGMSRRMIAYYENGDRDIPLTVELACAAIDRGIRSYTPPKKRGK